MDSNKIKIVVFGQYNAGKSTFIHSVDPTSRHIEAKNEEGTTTVALDFGRVKVGTKKIFLFGTPGQDRFEFARKIVSRGMHGAIVMVDSTGDVDERTYTLCEWLTKQDIPFAIMLNKCDHPLASPEKFADILDDGYGHLISARTGENVMESLSAFVDRIDMLAGKKEYY
jgi:small GTP-binding protein